MFLTLLTYMIIFIGFVVQLDEMRKAIKRNLISKKDVDEDICRESVVETAKELNIELTTEQITAYCSSEELIDEDTRGIGFAICS